YCFFLLGWKELVHRKLALLVQEGRLQIVLVLHYLCMLLNEAVGSLGYVGGGPVVLAQQITPAHQVQAKAGEAPPPDQPGMRIDTLSSICHEEEAGIISGLVQ